MIKPSIHQEDLNILDIKDIKRIKDFMKLYANKFMVFDEMDHCLKDTGYQSSLNSFPTINTAGVEGKRPLYLKK